MKRLSHLPLLRYAATIQLCFFGGCFQPALSDQDATADTAVDSADDDPDAPDTQVDLDTDLSDTSLDAADTAVEGDAADTAVEGDTAEPADAADLAEVDDTVEPDGDTHTTETDVAQPLPLDGFGTITGPCGFLDDELFDAAPSFFVNALDFAQNSYDIEDFDALTPHGQEMILDGNAGGSSLFSEVFAMEVLARCELATLIASETEILYDVAGKITDILVQIDGERVGVSVVRAVGFPKDAPYTVEQATTIIERKLSDILQSTANVSDEHRWVKQILSVLAYADQHVESVRTAWENLPAATRADTIIIVTVTHGADLFIY